MAGHGVHYVIVNYKEYKSLRDQLKSKHEELVSQAEVVQGGIKALDRVWQLFGNAQSSFDETLRAHRVQEPGSESDPPNLSYAVREYVAGIDERFTSQNIQDFIEATYPSLRPEAESSYSKPLRRMVESGELVVVNKASGTKRTVYQKPKGGA